MGVSVLGFGGTGLGLVTTHQGLHFSLFVFAILDTNSSGRTRGSLKTVYARYVSQYDLKASYGIRQQ